MNLQILTGDWIGRLRTLPEQSVQTCVTSPPYWGLRDYGVPGQLGLEKTPEEYVAKLVAGFREVRRVLRDDATLWINLGDSYVANGSNQVPQTKQHVGSGFAGPNRDGMSGLAPKNLVGIPWRVAFALQNDGWWLRSDIIWHKPNPMPESVTDRPTKAHEYIFLFSKRPNYFFDAEAIKEPATCDRIRGPALHPDLISTNGNSGLSRAAYRKEFEGKNRNQEDNSAGRRLLLSAKESREQNGQHDQPFGDTRNKRSVWTVASDPYKEAHFATFPPDLIKPCILAGTSAKGCCPKCGAPWERIVETHNPSKEFNAGEDLSNGAAITANPQTSTGLHRNGGGVYSSSTTLGWQPTCDCGYKNHLSPCTVLDPFAGSGTTGQVALELGRKAILIELNPKYVELIHQRTNVTPGLALA